MNSHEQSQSQSDGGAGGEGSTRCDCCKSCGAILELDGCGHRFHPRCVYTYPMTQCELCSAPVRTVKIFRVFKNSQNTMVRKGKWSADEHKYANMMMKQFQMGAMPLVDGLHLRGFIANVLQCDPLRVTKKYSGHAIGKQNFCFQRHKSYCYNLHTKMQKRISSLRNHFYWHIQYRCKFGYSMNIQELKSAEADYWIREFLKFAKKIGQPVEFSAPAVEVVSPTPSPVKPPPTPASPATPSATAREQHVVGSVLIPVPASTSSSPQIETQTQQKTIVPPTVTVSLAVESNELTPEPEAMQLPSFKLRGSAALSTGAVSPLSFDEWREQEAPSFMDILDKTLLADFAKQQSQFSASLSEMLGPQAKSTLTPGSPSAQSASLASSQNGAAASRCSLRDWILEEESRWNDSITGASWSFSLTLSDCA